MLFMMPNKQGQNTERFILVFELKFRLTRMAQYRDFLIIFSMLHMYWLITIIACVLCVKLQHLAAACIQRNVRKLTGIQEWPWWRLYVKVKPLLNVQRTEEELRDKDVCMDLVLHLQSL